MLSLQQTHLNGWLESGMLVKYPVPSTWCLKTGTWPKQTWKISWSNSMETVTRPSPNRKSSNFIRKTWRKQPIQCSKTYKMLLNLSKRTRSSLWNSTQNHSVTIIVARIMHWVMWMLVNSARFGVGKYSSCQAKKSWTRSRELSLLARRGTDPPTYTLSPVSKGHPPVSLAPAKPSTWQKTNWATPPIAKIPVSSSAANSSP